MDTYADETELENQKWDCQRCHKGVLKDRLSTITYHLNGTLLTGEVCADCRKELEAFLRDLKQDHIDADIHDDLLPLET